MYKTQKNILWLKEIGIKDVPLVGGKNASLGEMYTNLTPKGVRLPDGFALTTNLYWEFLKANGLDKILEGIFKDFNPQSVKSIQGTGKKCRDAISKGELPEDLKKEILDAYSQLAQKYGPNPDVAVRTSGVCEDMPSISRNEPVLVKFNGEIIYTTIEEFYEKWENTPQAKRELSVLSLEDNKIKWRPVENIYRHPIKGKRLIKILTKSGRKITVTPDHSLVGLNTEDLKLQTLRIKDVNKDTRIPVIKKIPLDIKKRKSVIDVREIIKSEPLLFENGRVKIKKGLWKTQKSFPNKIKIDKNFAYFLGIYASEGSTYKKSCVDISCESEIITNKVKKYLKRSFNLFSNQNGKNVRVFSQPLVVILHELLGFPLEKKGKGRFAKIKKVPNLIFNQDEKIIEEFLRGCFDGDGWIDKNIIGYSSVSEELIGGMVKLLEILGINYYLEKKCSRIVIPASEAQKFKKLINFTEEKQKKKLRELIQNYKKIKKPQNFIDTIPASKRISEFLEQKLKPILELKKIVVKVCPKCGKVMRKFGTGRDYKERDIKIQRYYCKNCNFYPTERSTLFLKNKSILRAINYDEKGRFRKGTFPWNKGNRKRLITYGISYLKRVAQRIKSKELLKIVNSDVIWDRIKKIELIKYSGYVYDFIVPGPQNFAAGIGGIITHNTASFAGQFETYLNVRGGDELLNAIRKCIASTFNDRAIAYRDEKKIGQLEFALSVGVLKMVRSDLASSGVIFTLDTETGFPNVVLINSIWGVGELIVKGKITPDEFFVFKPTLKDGYKSIIVKNLGRKIVKYVYSPNGGLKEAKVKPKKQLEFSLNDEEILTLSRWAVLIEEHYSAKYGKWMPQDIEWAKDGKTGELFIVQSRPETVHASKTVRIYEEYELKTKKKPILTGIAIGEKIGFGKVKVIENVSKIGDFEKGELLVTKMTDPDWLPIMRIASAIVTDEGGKTCHSAIVSRELGLPCIVGTQYATKILKTGKTITIDCTQGLKGRIFLDKVLFKVIKHDLKKVPKIKTKISMNIGDPQTAFKASFLPNNGVGLAREEFIIAEKIRVHPMALYNFEKIKDKKLKKRIQEITIEHKDKKEFFVKELAEGIAQIAAGFYPKEVIVRFSDFKTNEYRNLVGGNLFESEEANPMLGFRGACRYISEKYQPAFLMECEAIKRVREVFGLKNVNVMIPFCRTVEEGKKVLSIMKEGSLERGKEGLKVYVMCEIPSNVILAEEFLEIFDGFSIGSNDLTQLTLGLDRDSASIAYIGDERNEAVKELLRKVIKVCREKGKYSGICGEAPSNYPEFAEFLVEQGIESMSLNPHVVLKTHLIIAEKEKKLNH